MVIEHGSFSQAAKAMGISKSIVSKHITALEYCFKIQLIERSTRKLVITEAGKTFYNQIKDLPNQLISAGKSLESFQSKPQGRLKVYAPINLCASIKNDIIPLFLSTYPDVILDIKFVRPVEQYLQETFDIIILWNVSSKPFPNYNLYMKKLFTTETGLYATKKYLDKHGKPKHPNELTKHNCFSSIGSHWPFIDPKDSKIFYIDVQGNLLSQSDELMHAATLKDIGISYEYPFLFSEELATKKVKKVLNNYTDIHIDVAAFYHPSQYIPLKITTFLEIMQQHYDKLYV